MKASIVEIDDRPIKFNKRLGIIENGVDNLYAERADRIITNSVTAKMSAAVMASYLAGKGFGESDDELVVWESRTGGKDISLRKFSQKLAKSFSKQRGAFINVTYNGNQEVDGFKVLPYTHCRLGKKDDNNYNGKIVIFKDWEKATKKKIKEEGIIIDAYNPKKEVVAAQMEAAGGARKYKGQVWYVNLDEDEYDYALSQADSAMNDCDSEAQAAIFKNRSLRRGFFGKTMMVTKPLSGNLEDYENEAEYHKAQSERDAFKDTIDDFMGAENVGGALVVEMDAADDDNLDEAIKFETISSDIDDKLFSHTEDSVHKNILVAFNNIPAGLVRSDNTLFSTSGEAFQKMKETYQENTTEERTSLEETVNELTERLEGFARKVNLIPLIDTNTQTTED